MNDNSRIIPEQPADPREVVRALCVAVGKCQEFNVGDIVWTLYCGRWSKARVRRRASGGVYPAELITYPGNGTFVIVSASTCGGKVAAK